MAEQTLSSVLSEIERLEPGLVTRARWSTLRMAQGSRPERVGEEIRQELARSLAREVHDPGIGFVTLTRVKVSPDLQVARVYYTTLGDDQGAARPRARSSGRRRSSAGRSARPSGCAACPNCASSSTRSVEHQDRIERILLDLQRSAKAGAASEPSPKRRTPRPRIRTRISRDRLGRRGRRAIRARQSFLLTSHARPDGDAVGSQLALAFALDRLGKSVRLFDRDPVPAPYRAFPGVDRIQLTDRVAETADAAWSSSAATCRGPRSRASMATSSSTSTTTPATRCTAR